MIIGEGRGLTQWSWSFHEAKFGDTQVLQWETLKHYQLLQWNRLTGSPFYKVSSEIICILLVWLLALLVILPESLVICLLINLASPQYCFLHLLIYDCVLWGEGSIIALPVTTPATCIARTPFGHLCCIAILSKVAKKCSTLSVGVSFCDVAFGSFTLDESSIPSFLPSFKAFISCLWATRCCSIMSSNIFCWALCYSCIAWFCSWSISSTPVNDEPLKSVLLSPLVGISVTIY